MLKGIDKAISKTVSTVVAIILLVATICGVSYMFVGLGSTGMDQKLGEVGGQAAQDFWNEGVPAAINVAKPAWDASVDAVGGYVEDLRPTGQSHIGDGITIDWDAWFGGGGVVINNTPQPGGGGGNPTSVPTGCSVASTPESTAAYNAWMLGDWDSAWGNLAITNPSVDCLAATLGPVFQQFDTALRSLQNADQNTFMPRLQQVRRLNPAYPGTYAAEAFYHTATVLNTRPYNWNGVSNQLAGARLSVTAVDTKWANLASDEDIFTIAVDFGYGWAAQWNLLRPDAEDLAQALGMDKNTLTTLNAVVVIPGSYMPNTTPSVPDPLSGNAPVVPTQGYVPQATPTNQVQDVQPTNAPQNNGGNVTCTYPGAGSGEYMWAWAQRVSPGISWVFFADNNATTLSAYQANPSAQYQVVLPSGTTCP